MLTSSAVSGAGRYQIIEQESKKAKSSGYLFIDEIARTGKKQDKYHNCGKVGNSCNHHHRKYSEHDDQDKKAGQPYDYIKKSCIHCMNLRRKRIYVYPNRGAFCDKKALLISVRQMIVTIMSDPIRERSDILERLAQAVALLEQSLDVRLIPDKGANIAFARRAARDAGDVAAVQGGIINMDGKPHAAGPCSFGVDEDSARLVLTAMKFDPLMRSAATLRFSKKTLKVIGDLFLDCSSFDHTHAPPGIQTMDWGVASCCREGVPDVCYDYGGPQKEALIRIFGEKPIDVANNIIMISNRIINIEL